VSKVEVDTPFGPVWFLGAMGAALRAALDTAFSGRTAAMVGLSAGALVAMAAKPTSVRRLLLVEPFLRTAHVEAFGRIHRARGQTPYDLDLLWNLFGVAEGRTEKRDYRHLLGGVTVPTRVIVGGMPTNAFTKRLPSFVGDVDRAHLSAHPLVELQSVPEAGHNVASQRRDVFFPALQATCREALAARAAGGGV